MALLWIFVALGLGLALGFGAGRRRERAIRDATEGRRRDVEQRALLDQLAGGLAHEIRNPLSTLSMHLQLLREDWGNPVSEREQRGAKRLDTILGETRRLEKIMEDLLRFSAGHRLRPEPVDLNALLGELLDFYSVQADRAGIRLTREFSIARIVAEADANLVRQAVHNLLVNAQQAMPSGGQIVIRTALEGANAAIAVRDDGPGIPPEYLDRIFNLYFSTKPGSTGLGLPMSKRIVEEHGGSIEVSSRPGEGSTFTIRLPLRPGSIIEDPGS